MYFVFLVSVFSVFRLLTATLRAAHLLLGVDERLEDEGRAQLGGLQRHHAVVFLGQRRRDVATDLPHEAEVRVLKQILVLKELGVVSPYPLKNTYTYVYMRTCRHAEQPHHTKHQINKLGTNTLNK